MEFKKGDRVKIISLDFPTRGSIPGSYLGIVGEIIGSFDGVWKVEFENGGMWFFPNRALTLVKSGTEGILPIKYVVSYEENSIDPIKTFSTDKELKEWLAEVKDEDINFSSIRVFEVKKELKVKTSFKLVG